MLTLGLIKRRSEHYDGNLRDLQEISLHQFDLENIDQLQKYCPKLKIVYLQSNQLVQLPTLRLYYLDTLMLQMNNLTDVYGLQECPNLKTLDLTLNFINNLDCLNLLYYNKKLENLALEGNPIHSHPEYKNTILSFMELKQLDHQQTSTIDIEQAKQLYPNKIQDVMMYLDNYSHSKITIKDIKDIPFNQQITAEEFANQSTGHSIKERVATARELAIIRQPIEVVQPQVKKESTQMRQCNQLGFKYTMDSTTSMIHFKIYIPRIIHDVDYNVQCTTTHITITHNSLYLCIKSLYPMDSTTIEATRSKASGLLLLNVYKSGHHSNTLPSHQITFKSTISTHSSSTTTSLYDLPDLV